MKFFYHEDFDNRSYQYTVFNSPIINDIADKKIILAKSDLLSAGKILTRNQEYEAFKKYNYYKYRIHLYSLDNKISHAKRTKYVTQRQADLDRMKEFLIKCNIRLIVKPTFKFSKLYTMDSDDIFSLGILDMFRIIDNFDYRKGFKFSTYCLNSITRNFYTHCTKPKNKNLTYIDDNDYMEPQSPDDAEGIINNVDLLESNIKVLNKSESLIIKAYFGIDGHTSVSIKELSKKLKVSTQRLHQIKKNAINKMKKNSMK